MLQAADYFEFCEHLWDSWRRGDLAHDASLKPLFELDRCPEPYLVFGEGDQPLYVLLANPGFPMEHQHRDELGSGAKHGVLTADSYATNARRLAAFYTSDRFTQAAKTGPAFSRTRKFLAFAELIGYDHVVQVEMLPFHSRSLDKNRALRAVAQSELLQTYLDQLRRQLADRPVLSMTGCQSPALSGEGWAPWVQKLKEVMRMGDYEQHSIARRGGRTSGGFLVSIDLVPKGLYAVVGNSNLPREDGLQRMVAIWRERWGPQPQQPLA